MHSIHSYWNISRLKEVRFYKHVSQPTQQSENYIATATDGFLSCVDNNTNKEQEDIDCNPAIQTICSK